MPQTPRSFGRWSGAGSRLLIAACITLTVQACGGGGGGGGTPTPVDHARLDVCVLTGANVADGCTTSGTDPQIQLGDMEMGQTKSRVVALYDGGDGDVAATVSAIALAPAAGANYSLSIFTVQSGVETPATLPFDLRPNHATELRVRVQFVANVAVGAVSGVSLAVTASHPAGGSANVAVIGNVTGCPAGKGDCDNDPSNACETDLLTTVAHCGGCGTACDATHGTPSCTDGVCGITCDPGYANCDLAVGNGCESELATDAAHCGTCANACSTANGTPSCTAGSCSIACAPGFADCDNDPTNGCEVNLDADPTHCGACGTVCNSTNGTATCSAGACGITCNSGFGDCDGQASTGCEVNLDSDTGHCGVCGTACNSTNGTASCSAGVCGITCNSGFADCDGLASTGCEVNLDTDPAHCGSCVSTCSANNGVPSCSAGQCGIACFPGFADCNLSSTDGCEASLTTDPAHCGTCGTACNATNGVATCQSSTCGITCNAGWANCDSSLANGCEVNLLSDPANCSACGAVCSSTNGTASCDAGACGITCDVGYGNCDAAVPGCETNLTSDPNNCNACGDVCPAPANGLAGCTGGTCGIASCNPGYADCDHLATDGCEVNTTNDVANCGTCGAVCPATANVATPGCSGSACTIVACVAGWTNYDGAFSDGCECKTPVASRNCGAPTAIPTPTIGGAAVIEPVDGIPDLGDAAYYVVSFPYGGTPRIAFQRNDGGQAVFDVLLGCASNPTGCSGTEAGGVTQWSFYDSYNYNYRGVAWPSTVIVRVRRAPTSTTCATYQIYAAQ